MAFLAPILMGSAATAGAAGAAGTAATAGLIGTGGAFAAGQALMTAGTLMGVAGGIQAGRAAGASAKFNAAMSQMQARQQEQQIRTQARRQIGAVRANVAKSGVTMEGTPLLVMAESAANAEVDALNARWTGDARASMYHAQGKADRRQASLNAGTSLLVGASKIF
jgi:hypothetical protein